MDRNYIKGVFLESMVLILFGKMLAKQEGGGEFLEEFIKGTKDSLIETVRSSPDFAGDSDSLVQEIEEIANSFNFNLSRYHELFKSDRDA